MFYPCWLIKNNICAGCMDGMMSLGSTENRIFGKTII